MATTPQKINYPETFNVDIDEPDVYQKATEIISLLRNKGYNTNTFIGNTSGKTRYVVENKNVTKCITSSHYPYEESISNEGLKRLFKVIDVINTGTFNLNLTSSGRPDTRFIRDFFDNLSFNRGNYDISSKNLTYCFIDFTLNYADYRALNPDLPLVKEEDIKLILKYCNLTKKEENMTQEKKIIGYIPKNEEFDKAICGVCNMTSKCGRFMPISDVYNSLIKLGVLELWCEPIYEETEKEITVSGAISLKIKDKRVFHKNEDITDYVIEIAQIWKNLKDNSKIAGYDFIVGDVMLVKTGCETKKTFLSDWYSVYLQIK